MTYDRMKAKKLKDECCFICGDEDSPLVKTKCCHQWVCCDTSFLSFRGGGYCLFEHENYSVCHYHYNNNHEGKWEDCKECQEFFGKEAFESELNFKPKIKNQKNFRGKKQISTITKQTTVNEDKGEIVIYQPEKGTFSIKVKLAGETLWLNLNQIAELFDRDKSVISRHLNGIFKSGELKKSATVAKNATVQLEGNRKVIRQVEYFNLDVIIAVGYRVNSKQGTQFRIWATDILKQHLKDTA